MGVIFAPEIQCHIQKKPAIFTSGERDKNMIKFFENKVHPLLKRLIYSFFQILPNHITTTFLLPYIVNLSKFFYGLFYHSL